MARPRTHRRLRAWHRAIWEFAYEAARRHGGPAPGVVIPRWHRRGHDIEREDFLPSDDWHSDNGYTEAEFAAADSGFLAWLGTLAACGRRVEDWQTPDDEPAPVEPLAELTPIAPTGPPFAPLREAPAA
jgi:hypothetical protein